ncbi:acyltransferase [Salinigranum sp. GCM10025319]|uniref:acyltransferase n=1 Tax=Salinigranum sp. GCM10025319 TaxID=3252687 RepID=UPI003609DE97
MTDDAAGGHGDDSTDRADGRGDSGDSDGATRHDRLARHPTSGPGNSLMQWTDAKSPLTVARNYAVILVARMSPSLRLKTHLFRALGMRVGSGVAWGLESTPDVFWPELITIEDDAIVGYDATLLCHEFLQEEYRTGEVHVGERAMIGAGAVVLPGVRIGAGAQVAANSLVDDDVPAGTTVAGVPATPVSRDDAADDEG